MNKTTNEAIVQGTKGLGGFDNPDLQSIEKAVDRLRLLLEIDRKQIWAKNIRAEIEDNGTLSIKTYGLILDYYKDSFFFRVFHRSTFKTDEEYQDHIENVEEFWKLIDEHNRNQPEEFHLPVANPDYTSIDGDGKMWMYYPLSSLNKL